MNEQQPFEAIRKSDEAGREYWSARNLGPLLDYKEWRNFYKVIAKAIISCEASGHPSADHFVETNKMVELGSGASRNLEDFHLSRYACYLVVQNGDPSKPVIAAGKRTLPCKPGAELQDDQIFKSLREDEKRLFLRNELKEHNKHLVETAQRAGVETTLDFAVFQNHGYKGLYGGLDQKQFMSVRPKEKPKILDYMGSTELAANLFRATQTEENYVGTRLIRSNSPTKRIMT